ncbi:hypothetical protein [Sphingobacterium faecium]|uniref:hypothetical protein n=1 Tax=Sphingobacterium faecium TaxID=34087 RepID=UPI002468D9C0|nr:hypothetical protein [Sphingobacterium faecium]MDH5827766.1 hypothetical protein [Sphingobacterium faecium]
MKKIYNIFMLVSLIMITACSKSDNATMPDGIVYLNQPQIVKVSGDPAILDTDPLGFKAKITVDLYYKDSQKPDYLDLVIVKNGDAKNAKVIKAKISTYPTEMEVDGKLLTELFGTIVSGDNYDFGTNYIVGEKTYVAFPEGGGIPYGPNTASQPDASPTVRYSAICGFDVDEFIGDGKFLVTVDGWEDFGVDAEAEVKKVDASTIAITYPIPAFKPIILKVNTGDNTVTVNKQEVGDYGNWGYGIFSVVSAGGGTANYVNPCNGIIQVNLSYTVAAGGFGAKVLELKKIQ